MISFFYQAFDVRFEDSSYKKRINRIQAMGQINMGHLLHGLSVFQSIRMLMIRKDKVKKQIESFKHTLDQASVRLPISYIDYMIVRLIVRLSTLFALPVLLFFSSSHYDSIGKLFVGQFYWIAFLVFFHVLTFIDHIFFKYRIILRKRKIESKLFFFMNLIESNVHNGDNIQLALENSKDYLNVVMLDEVKKTLTEIKTFGVYRAMSNFSKRVDVDGFDKFIRLLVIGSKSPNTTLYAYLKENREKLRRIKEDRLRMISELKPTAYHLINALSFASILLIALFPTVIRLSEKISSF